MRKKTCRYCGSSWMQTIGIFFTLPHCKAEKAARIKKALKIMWLYDKSMVEIIGVDLAEWKDKAVKSIHYIDKNWEKHTKVIIY